MQCLCSTKITGVVLIHYMGYKSGQKKIKQKAVLKKKFRCKKKKKNPVVE